MRFFGIEMIDGMVKVPGPVSLPLLSYDDIVLGTIDPGAMPGGVVFEDAPQTLTNKTIDTATNTIIVEQGDVIGLTASLALKLDAASYTAADVLSKLLTVDGTGSGLDADTLDGLSSAAFSTAVHTHSYADITSGSVADGSLSANVPLKNASNTYTATNSFTATRTIITNTQPRLVWNETDAAAGTQQYEFIVSAGAQIRRMMNDDGTFGANYEVCTRAANVITNWSMVATVVTITGNLSLGTAGNKMLVKEGSNASMGVATLVAGAATVATTLVTASSRIFLTVQSLGTVTSPKAVGVTARTAATSFVITSADATDTSVVAWHIIEPA